MISWTLYIAITIVLGFSLAYKSKRFSKLLFILIMVLFLTPAQISPNNEEIAPSIYAFLFNLLFEAELSLRPLRPLVLVLPISLLGYILVAMIRRKFF